MIRVLHADDNETDRLLVRRELGRAFADVEVQAVRDQAEFEAALKAPEFDLVIVDYQLGWSNGLEVLHAVKSGFPQCPVVMFTGTGNEEIAVAAMKEGLDDYVVKSPQHMIRLVTAVRSALDKAAARRRAVAAEEEREELLQREQAARAEAERLLEEAREADRRKDHFIAMLAHELRNPLAAITNAVHLQEQAALPQAERIGIQGMLKRQVEHLGRIVHDLLDATRVKQGKIELRRESVDLAGLVREVLLDHRGVFESAGLEALEGVPDEPVWVQGDRTRLTQVMANLLQNAAKFTNPGGRVEVRLAVDAAAQQAVLTVQDTGVGIDAALLPRLFEVFIQAEQPLDRSQGGLGLGLALTKGLVELHGGGVSAASEGCGKGAAFTVRLPLASEPSARGAADKPAAHRTLRILVIEDSKDGAESLRLLLQLSGHEVHVAHTGSAGVEKAKAFRPQVVLCDLGLPGGMSGFEVAQVLRRDPATAGARLIAVSGYGQPEDQTKAKSAGFELHLTKPVDPIELQDKLMSS